MKSSFSRSVIDEIKAKLSIVDVIQGFVSLNKSGKDYAGLCPFHDDKNPSMRVNDEKGFFHCFSCGAGGDMFGFLMKYNNIGFGEALRELATKAGVRLPSYERKSIVRGRESSSTEKFFEINSRVSSFYRKTLSAHPVAENYLRSRGITQEISDLFGIGYAPDSWDALLRFAKKNKISVEDLQSLGLLISSEKSGECYDRFRNRVIFPIHEISGKVCGFGGRAISESSPKQAKYINSPESAVFDKKNVLFGLFRSKSEIRREKKAILVEGYMDFIKLYASGIRNVVATLGTAFTKEHATLLRRLCPEVVIVYDGDDAGISSAIRAGRIFLQQGLFPQICRIPEGLDPDDYVEAHGPEGLKEIVTDAQGVSNFIIDDTFAEYRKKKISSGEAMKLLSEMVSLIEDPIRRAEAVTKTTGIFGIRESEFLSMVNNLNSEKNRGSLASSVTVPKKNVYEREIVRILLKYPDLISLEKIKDVSNLLRDADLRNILDFLGEEDFTEVSSLMGSFQSAEMQQLLSGLIISSDDLIDEETSEKTLHSCLRKLELREIEVKRNEVVESIRRQQGSSDKTVERDLIRQYGDLLKIEERLKGVVH